MLSVAESIRGGKFVHSVKVRCTSTRQWRSANIYVTAEQYIIIGNLFDQKDISGRKYSSSLDVSPYRLSNTPNTCHSFHRAWTCLRACYRVPNLREMADWVGRGRLGIPPLREAGDCEDIGSQLGHRVYYSWREGQSEQLVGNALSFTLPLLSTWVPLGLGEVRHFPTRAFTGKLMISHVFNN